MSCIWDFPPGMPTDRLRHVLPDFPRQAGAPMQLAGRSALEDRINTMEASHMRDCSARRWPFFGPRGCRVVVRLHTTPESRQTPHCGCSLSQRSFRLRHSSQASPACWRGRGVVALDCEGYMLVDLPTCYPNGCHDVICQPYI